MALRRGDAEIPASPIPNPQTPIPNPHPNIALIGMMGSGKSTVGRALAARLGWTFCDTDEVIVAREGRPIPDIFREPGEAYFRDVEAAVVAEAASGERRVIATGGGAILREDTRKVLWTRCLVVWLTASAEEHAARVARSERRPVLERYADPVAAAREVLASREHLYRLAHVTVDTTGRTVDEVVDGIVGAMEPAALGG